MIIHKDLQEACMPVHRLALLRKEQIIYIKKQKKNLYLKGIPHP